MSGVIDITLIIIYALLFHFVAIIVHAIDAFDAMHYAAIIIIFILPRYFIAAFTSFRHRIPATARSLLHAVIIRMPFRRRFTSTDLSIFRCHLISRH